MKISDTWLHLRRLCMCFFTI